MYGLPSTAPMSSTRPPMLAGPMPRNTKRLTIGSFDQLTGVGVGLGAGACALWVCGAGPCEAAGVCEAFGFCAWTASVPRTRAHAPTNNHFHSRIARNVSFIGELSFRLSCVAKETADAWTADVN